MTEEGEEKLYEDVKYEITDLKTVFLIGVYFQTRDLENCKEHLDELEDLANTYGFEVVKKALCPLKKIDARAYLGSGKIIELVELAKEYKADVIIFDDEISPNQQRNLELAFKKPLIDRTELILEVFAQRAETKEAKIQIELARSRYQLPRLKRLWTHLSRQRSGGQGYLRGAGETQIEIDRRLLRKCINKLQCNIKEVYQYRALQRKARQRCGIPTFAIIGYTNVGKSTLLNALTNAGVLVEDKLFATLDTTARKFSLPNHQQVLLIDTVGFIRKLPHTLVEAFKSTLEEALFTDVLIHLVDAHHPLAVEQAEATYEVLRDLKAEDRAVITVLNKMDLCDDEVVISTFKAKYPDTITISAKTHDGFESLMELMQKEVQKLRITTSLRIPQEHYALVTQLMEEGNVIETNYDGNDILLTVEIPTQLEYKVTQFVDQNPPSQ